MGRIRNVWIHKILLRQSEGKRPFGREEKRRDKA
jgi:hypothetical protein